MTAAGVESETAATPRSAPSVSLFADPIHLNVFRIKDLLREGTDAMKRNSVSYDKIMRYLKLPT